MFINFKPDPNKPYGGGNISTYYLQEHLKTMYSGFKVVYDFSSNIDIYLIIDPFKDRKHKLYGIADIIHHRNNKNPTGKIVYRVNDCDATRPTIRKDQSREHIISQFVTEIDYFIYNSEFIRSMYFKKGPKFTLKPNTIIRNGCDLSMFYPNKTPNDRSEKIRIVSHHWSNNMHKGYQMYYDLWKYCRSTNLFEFIFNPHTSFICYNKYYFSSKA